VERVWYEAGNEHSPTDPFGRNTLDLGADGELRLDHRGRDGNRAWTAHTEPDFLARLGRALRAAGFPAAPMVMPPAGSRMRVLRVTGEPAGEVLLPWHEALKIPGYDQVFGLLDGLVAAVAGIDLRAPVLAPLPTEIRPVPEWTG
jgi:hypothetical protein